MARDDSDTDTEDDLDRILGPSSKPGNPKKKVTKMKTWQRCCTIFTIFITLSGLLAVLIMGTIVYPQTIRNALALAGIVHNNEVISNSTEGMKKNPQIHYKQIVHKSSNLFSTDWHYNTPSPD